MRHLYLFLAVWMLSWDKPGKFTIGAFLLFEIFIFMTEYIPCRDCRTLKLRHTCWNCQKELG